MSTQPSSSFATLRPDLAGSLLKFDLDAASRGFVGLDIAPVIEVDKPVGQYGVIEVKDLLRTQETRRASDGAYNRGQARATKDSYSCDEHGFEEPVDDREAEMFGDWWDAEQLATSRARDAVLANHNTRVVTMALAVSNTNAAGNVWTGSSGTPITNLIAAKLAVRSRTGLVPNAMVIDIEVFMYLRLNPQMQDAAWGTVNPKKGLTISEVQAAMDLEYLHISGAVKNTALEPAAATLSSVWDKTKAFVFVKNLDRDLRRPRYANTFHWGADGSQVGAVIETYRDESKRSDIVRARMDTDEKEVYSSCGQVITGVAA